MEEKEFDYKENYDAILKENGHNDPTSDEALQFTETKEFNDAIESRKKAFIERNEETKDNENDGEDENKEESNKDEKTSFSIKNLDEEGFDPSKHSTKEWKSLINNHSKEIRENYEKQTQEITKQLEIANSTLKEKESEIEKANNIFDNLPGFLAEKLGIDKSQTANIVDAIGGFAIEKAAQAAGKSPQEYIQEVQNKAKAMADAKANLESNSTIAAQKFAKENELFKLIDNPNKESLLKDALIKGNYKEGETDVYKVARNLFIDEFDELLEKRATKKALDSKGSSLKEIKGQKKGIKQTYDVKNDPKFKQFIENNFK